MNLLWFLRAAEQDDNTRKLNAELRGSRKVLWLTAFAMASFFGWAYLSEIDQISRAPGAVIPSSKLQVVQSKEGGKLLALPVKAGDEVKQGDVVARFDETEARADYLETKALSESLSATMARLNAELFGGDPQFSNALAEYPQFKESQLQLLNKRRSAIEQEIAATENILVFIREEISMNKPLMADGDVSKTEILRLQREEAELVAKLTNTKNNYLRDVQEELTQTQEEYERTRQALIQRERLLEDTVLRAPVSGIVKNVRVTTEGGVIRPGEDVVEIVPIEDDLLIEAKLSTADIGFVKIGQRAKVKIDAYDFTIYGDLTGEVSYISADTLLESQAKGETPYYRIHVRTEGRSFSGRPNTNLQILPGMTATVEVLTGKNTILNYLLKPLTKTIAESMGER